MGVAVIQFNRTGCLISRSAFYEASGIPIRQYLSIGNSPVRYKQDHAPSTCRTSYGPYSDLGAEAFPPVRNYRNNVDLALRQDAKLNYKNHCVCSMITNRLYYCRRNGAKFSTRLGKKMF